MYLPAEGSVMAELRDKKMREQAPIGLGPIAWTDGMHFIPNSVSNANGRPDLCVRMVGGLTVVELVNAEALFQEGTIHELGEGIRRLVEEGHVRILVNLSGVRYASSSLVALLARLYLRLDTAGGELSLCGLEPVVLDMLRICCLVRVVEVYANESEALLTMHAIGD
jgi:anti-sigma B factor antagonist